MQYVVPFIEMVMNGSMYCGESLRPIFSTRMVIMVFPGTGAGGGNRFPFAVRNLETISAADKESTGEPSLFHGRYHFM